MKALSGLARVSCVALFSIACIVGLSACGSGSTGAGLTAATVNGTAISEEKITNQIQAIREYYSLTDTDTWGQYLASVGYEPSELRDDILESYIDEEVVKIAAKEEGITVSAEEIDEYVDSIKSQFESEAAWQEALKTNNLTEEEYRESIETSLLEERLGDLVLSRFTEDEQQKLAAFVGMYASEYSGMKRSSHILFASDDEATAKEVLEKINSGELSFEDAAAQYSTDSSASDGGDVGWDKMSTFVTAYQDALDALSKGEVSDLVTSTYGIHIIKCTDEYIAPEVASALSDLPSDIVETVESAISNMTSSTALSAYIANYRTKCDIVKNDMPKGLVYDVDISKYSSTTTSSTTTSN